MDIILTAIVIGFLFSVGLAFISGFVKAWKTLQQQSDDKPRTMIKDGKEYTVDPAAPMILVTIEKVTQKNCSVLLAYDRLSGRFLCQGETKDEIFSILRDRFSRFNIFKFDKNDLDTELVNLAEVNHGQN